MISRRLMGGPQSAFSGSGAAPARQRMGGPQNTEQQKADQQKKKAADDAYKAGLKIIPDANEKYDPWRTIR
jgi:hypothetical protein